MKRLLLWILLTVLVAPLALATTNYINNTTVSIMSPPQVAPQIDASNFVNNGIFFITNVYLSTGVQPPPPYQSWNTRNWTNANRMAGDSGFRFDYFDSIGQTNGWSANFQNAGNANPTNANIFGASYVLVAATNINNKGTMTVNGPSLMTLNGKNIDLTRGIFGAVGNETNDLAGVRDLYWGASDSLFGGFFSGNLVQSSPMLVTTIQFPPGLPPMYVPVFQFLQFTNPCGTNTLCTNGFTIYATTNQVFFNNAIHSAINVLFLRQTNPAISTDVRFSSFGGPGAAKIIQWQALQTNRVSGAVTTNRLFLADSFGSWGTPPFLTQTPWPIFSYTFLAAARFRPFNYSITHSAPFAYDTLPTLPPIVLDPLVFSGTNFPTFSTNVAWAATITGAAFPPDPTISGATWTNVPGRIEITASGGGSYLDLTRTLMDGQSYLLLSSTNHFIGSTNATIVAPVRDVYLSSTNGMMAISNLSTAFVPRMEGEIQAWSGRWTNVTALGLGTLYTVTMIDSALAEKSPSLIQNLSLRSTNLLIGDVLNVFASLLVDTERLTITTNALNAPTPRGELNFTSGDILWSANLPSLQYLTNFGRISCSNSIYLGTSGQTPPWISGTFDAPYQSIVTHGPISSVACSIWAKYFEASDTNDTGIGPMTVQADSAIVTNGTFLVTDADITLTCGTLLISNQVLQAGRGITLTVTNYLDDGSLSNSVDVITNQNLWTVGQGFSLPLLPTNASLLATTVTNTAFPNAEVDNYWAGRDYGCWPSGFGNNAALGRLILDGQDEGSLFAFFRTGLTNALYVDLLELKDATTNADSVGHFVGVSLQTNFTIYYGDAIANGQSIAFQLNGRYGLTGTNGGRFCWVSNYNTGFFSSTNLTYADGSGTHRLNRALVTSCNLDSNGNGIPNCTDPNPVPVLTPSTLVLKAVVTKGPPRAAVLSWNTIPLASNYLYAALSLPTTNWQPVTNFLSDETIGGQLTVTYPIGTNRALYYRVRVLSP